MPRKKTKPDKPATGNTRAEKRTKKVTIADVPEIVLALPDEGMQRAAMTLATCGYRKGSRRRNGAVMHAARTANVSRETIYNWLENPDFEDAIEEVNSMLVAECFAGLRMCVLRADAKGIVELMCQLDVELDLIEQRKRRDHEREKELLELRIRLADKTDQTEQALPQIVFRETAQGERIATPKDDELQ